MYINNERFNELLKLFGLSLKIENDSVIFTDIETNMQLESYKINNEGKRFEITDPKILLSGWPFHLESNNKHYVLEVIDGSLFGIDDVEENIEIRTIDVTKRNSQDSAERIQFKANDSYDYDSSYNIAEINYGKDGRIISSERFAAGYYSSDNIPGANRNLATIMYRSGTNRSDLVFHENLATGEVNTNFKNQGADEMSIKDLIEKVDNSTMFKETVNTLLPKLGEYYEYCKSNNVGYSR